MTTTTTNTSIKLPPANTGFSIAFWWCLSAVYEELIDGEIADLDPFEASSEAVNT